MGEEAVVSHFQYLTSRDSSDCLGQELASLGCKPQHVNTSCKYIEGDYRHASSFPVYAFIRNGVPKNNLMKCPLHGYLAILTSILK